jgi:ABC-2 type transport system permease protein
MRAVLATYLRELRAYFLSPLAYVVAFFFLAVTGFFFSWMVTQLIDPRAPSGPPMGFFFGMTWLFLIGLGTFLPMRLLSEELRSGSIEVLMTAPITEGQVVAGKYLAVLSFFGLLWLPTVGYAGILAHYGEVEWGPVASGYLGILLIGALFLAVGMFASAMSRSQLIAAVVTFAILIVLFVIGMLEQLASGEVWKNAFSFLNINAHIDEFATGVVDTRRIVYYVSASLFFLFLTSRALEDRKWR